MRFLIDNSLPERMADRLCDAGHDAVHVRHVGSPMWPDEVIFDFCDQERRIVVAQDTDFGTLLANREVASPSVVLFRCRMKTVDDLVPMLLANLPDIAADLESGAVVVFEDTRVRIRALPM